MAYSSFWGKESHHAWIRSLWFFMRAFSGYKNIAWIPSPLPACFCLYKSWSTGIIKHSVLPEPVPVVTAIVLWSQSIAFQLSDWCLYGYRSAENANSFASPSIEDKAFTKSSSRIFKLLACSWKVELDNSHGNIVWNTGSAIKCSLTSNNSRRHSCSFWCPDAHIETSVFIIVLLAFL